MLKKPSQMFAGLRSYFLLWSSQALSTLGSSMTSFALIIWAYKQQGTAMSVSLLAFCTYLPSICFCFVAGTLVDKWSKKAVMLICDTVAAFCTLSVLLLLAGGLLRVWHLYIVNTVIGFMNAFQVPASSVAVSLITPREQYTRVGGMQAFSQSLVTLLTPAIATAVLAFGGLQLVLAIDIGAFVFAFVILLWAIKIPRVAGKETGRDVPFRRQLTEGIGFLLRDRPLLWMILFFAAINLLASMGGNGIMPAMILARTGGNETTLGMVSSGIGVGALVGSIVVTVVKPPRKRTRVIFIATAISFLFCDVGWALGRSAFAWTAFAVLGNIPLPFLNANLNTIMRTRVPVEMQGRVFSAQSTLQCFTIPAGYLLGGALSDYLFEPFMAGTSRLSTALAQLVGSGTGSGMAVLLLATGVFGTALSLVNAASRRYRSLDAPEVERTPETAVTHP